MIEDTYLFASLETLIERTVRASQSSRKDGENIFPSFRSTIGENETISYIPSIGNRACHFPENGPSTEYTHTHTHTHTHIHTLERSLIPPQDRRDTIVRGMENVI